MHKTNFNSQEPPTERLLGLVDLFKANKFEALTLNCNELLTLFPRSIVLRNLLGAALTKTEYYDKALYMFQEALTINPQMHDTFNNIGSTYLKMGLTSLAIDNFKKAIEIEPSYIKAIFNLLEILIDVRLLREAEFYLSLADKHYPCHPEIVHYRGIISIHQNDHKLAIKQLGKLVERYPNFAEAFNSLGVANNEIGDLDEAIIKFSKAIEIDMNHQEAKQNLVDVFKKKGGYKKPDGEFACLDRQVKEILNPISLDDKDVEIATHISNAIDLIETASPELRTNFSQLFYRNGRDLNCKKAVALFESEEAISESCFNCFKVQIDVQTLIDLLRLSKIFYDIELKGNPTRKCMIEVRESINGSYKGFIYCSTINQAKIVQEKVNNLLIKRLPSAVSKIKRGCSEFALKFPIYADLNDKNDTLMKLQKNFKTVEKQFDLTHTFRQKPEQIPSSKNFGLSDCLIIRKWIDYSKGINDPSKDLFNHLPIKYEEIFKAGQKRT